MSAICWCCAYKVETSLACAFCCCPYECVKQTGRESSERVYVYKKPGLECWVDKIQQSFSPEFLADLKNPKYKLQLWDGSSLTQSELQQQLLDNVRTYSSPDYPGFVKERESDGIVYERNPSLEKEGNAFFRLVADLKIPADLAVAMLLDAQKIGCKDYALATVQFFHTFPDEQSFVVYSIAPPGGPIAWRDYVDFSSWRREEDGSLLQGATSCCSKEVPVFDGAIRGTMLIFGYHFKPTVGGVKASLVAQTAANGCLPSSLSNSFFSFFLTFYLRNLEQTGLDMIKAGTAEKFVSQFPNLGPLNLPAEFRG